jgi:hypothetical protein
MVELVSDPCLECSQYFRGQILLQLMGPKGTQQNTNSSNKSADLEVNSMHVVAVVGSIRLE